MKGLSFVSQPGEHTVGALVEFIGRDIARKGLKCPIQKRAVKLALGLFFPRLQPSFES